MTPLMWACYLNKPVAVKRLLKQNADLLEKDHSGRTAMHWVRWHDEDESGESMTIYLPPSARPSTGTTITA